MLIFFPGADLASGSVAPRPLRPRNVLAPDQGGALRKIAPAPRPSVRPRNVLNHAANAPGPRSDESHPDRHRHPGGTTRRKVDQSPSRKSGGKARVQRHGEGKRRRRTAKRQGRAAVQSRDRRPQRRRDENLRRVPCQRSAREAKRSPGPVRGPPRRRNPVPVPRRGRSPVRDPAVVKIDPAAVADGRRITATHAAKLTKYIPVPLVQSCSIINIVFSPVYDQI